MLGRPVLRPRPSRALTMAIVGLLLLAVVPLQLRARPGESGEAAVASHPVADLDVTNRGTGAPSSAPLFEPVDSGDAPDLGSSAAPEAGRASLVASSSPAVVEVVAAEAAQSTGGVLPPCATTAPVYARAPDDPNASPVTGWWHISTDKALWAPSPPPGEATMGVGTYWVRPVGQPLTVRGRRLDAEAPPVFMTEDSAVYGFFYGGPPTPTDGCWEFEVTSGASRVTFVVALHYAFEDFVRRPASRVTWEREVGAIESAGTRMAVTAVVVEDPETMTRRRSGARIDLSDADSSTTLYEPVERLERTRRLLETTAAGLFGRWSTRSGARTTSPVVCR